MAPRRRSIWKLLGLAGLAGVAATGVVVARSERERRSYTAEEVRARLHDRLESLEGTSADIHVRAEQLEVSSLQRRRMPWMRRRAKHG